MNIREESLKLHEINKGKIAIKSKVKLETKEDLSLAYTPGVAEACLAIAKDKNNVYKYTPKSNTIAVISDGSSVLGLGNIGAEAAIPVMEGKAILFKELANIDAFPICLSSQDTEEILHTVRNIAPVFGGINLEDIKAPKCFIIEEQLQDLGIPVMHDDQHCTAIVVLAGLINSLKLAGKDFNNVKIVMNGAGSAGIAICKLLLSYGAQDITLCDSQGIIYKNRPGLDSNKYKTNIAKITNKTHLQGNLSKAIKDADIFIGVSVKDILTKDMIQSMKDKPIIFALANPDPEIKPELAKEANIFILATGRSDYPNQVNNVLGFPGIFRGALDARATKITESMKLAAAEALANSIEPSTNQILPSPLNKKIVPLISKAVQEAWQKSN